MLYSNENTDNFELHYEDKYDVVTRNSRSKSCFTLSTIMFVPVLKPKLADFIPTPFHLVNDDSSILLHRDSSFLSQTNTETSESISFKKQKRNSEKRPKISILNLLKTKRKESSKEIST